MRPSQYRHLYTTACLSLLSELGITTLDELLCKNGKGQATLISSAELKRRYGSQAQAKHLRALNKLTVLAHEGTAGYAPYRTSYGGCAPLASCLRVIHQDVLEAEFRKHSQLQSRDVRGTRAPNSQLHGTQLIKNVFARAVQAPAHRSSLDAPPLDITIQKRSKNSRKRKPDSRYAARHINQPVVHMTAKVSHRPKRSKGGAPRHKCHGV